MTSANAPETAPAPGAAPPPGRGEPGNRAGDLWRRHRTFVLYAGIGCSGVLLDLVAFFVLFNLAGLDHQLANVIATTAGITNNFVWNSIFNFQKRDRILTRLLRFYTVGVLGMGLTAALLWLFTTVLGVDANLVKAGSLPVVLVSQFWLNKRWSFG